MPGLRAADGLACAQDNMISKAPHPPKFILRVRVTQSLGQLTWGSPLWAALLGEM